MIPVVIAEALAVERKPFIMLCSQTHAHTRPVWPTHPPHNTDPVPAPAAVHSEDVQGNVKRSIVHGPTVFIPEVTQWLHVFRWHGSPAGGDQGAKVPGALVFTKLRTIPDQFYYNAQVSGGVLGVMC